MPFNKFIKNLRVDSKGTSLVLMIMMVSAIVIVGATMMFITLGYFKLTQAFEASEKLYAKTEALSQEVFEQLETEIADILKNLNATIYEDEATTELNDESGGLLDLIDKYYGQSAGTVVVNLSMSEINTQLGTALQSGQGEMVAKALYDIAFKLKVLDEGGILEHNTDVKTLFDSAMPDEGTPAVFRKVSIEPEKVLSPNEGSWLLDVCNTPDSPPEYFSDTYCSQPTITYTICTENSKVSIQKNLRAVYELSSTAFQSSSALHTEDTITPVEISNRLFDKSLVSVQEVRLRGAGPVNLNGGIYAFGGMPDDIEAAQIVVPENTYRGITIDSNNKSVAVDGDIETRAYLRFPRSSANFSAAGSVICDTLLVDSNTTNNHINISGSLSTFNDIKVSGTGHAITIAEDYYGLNDGAEYVNRSSAIIVENPSSTPTIDIGGSAWIGGAAFLGNVTYTGSDSKEYAFKTGESTTIGQNYNIYKYRVDEDEFNDSQYENNVSDTDYKNWVVKDDANSSINLFCKYDADGNPDYEDPLLKTLLQKHFFYYAYVSAEDPIQFNQSVSRNGIRLDESKRHFAQYIINANDKSYWTLGTMPTGASAGTANFAQFSSPLYDLDDYRAYVSKSTYDPVNDVVKSKHVEAQEKLELLKAYIEDNIGDSGYDVNTAPTREDEYTDEYGKILSSFLPPDPNTYIKRYNYDSNQYYFYITKSNTDITIGGGGSTILANQIDEYNGIIYTKGKVTITPNNDFTFYGPIIALGGIEINNAAGNTVTIDVTTQKSTLLNHIINDMNAEAQVIRKFFAPGNYVYKSGGYGAIYRESGQNVRVVDKRLIRNP